LWQAAILMKSGHGAAADHEFDLIAAETAIAHGKLSVTQLGVDLIRESCRNTTP
jgi:hypothetical protein